MSIRLAIRGLRSAASLKQGAAMDHVAAQVDPRTQIRGLIEAVHPPSRGASRPARSADSDPRPH